MSYVIDAHAFIKDAIKLIEDHQEKEFVLDHDRFIFLMDGVKNTLVISFQNLHQVFQEVMKKK